MSLLSIGDLAARSGVAAGTLRMWEQRHGFPQPRRLESGHRRYDESDVELVREIARRRDAGTRLGAAVTQVLADRQPTRPHGQLSIYGELKRNHPHLPVHRLTKRTLVAMSHAIEDEFCSRADRPLLYGCFQRSAFFAPSQERWRELSRTAALTLCMADFDEVRVDGDLVEVPLDEDAPLRREWAVVCQSADLPFALSAWEVPGQHGVKDGDRLFEAVWTLDAEAVRESAAVCVEVARAAGADIATDVVEQVPFASPETALPAATSLFNRVVAYVDERLRR